MFKYTKKIEELEEKISNRTTIGYLGKAPYPVRHISGAISFMAHSDVEIDKVICMILDHLGLKIGYTGKKEIVEKLGLVPVKKNAKNHANAKNY